MRQAIVDPVSDDIKHRALGLGLLLLAAAVLAQWVGLPLREAQQHVVAVDVHPIVTIGCGPIIILGLALLLLGERSNLHVAETRAMTKRGSILALIGFAGGGVLYWWLQQQLSLLGYS